MLKQAAQALCCALLFFNVAFCIDAPDPFYTAEEKIPLISVLVPLSFAKARDVSALLQEQKAGLLSPEGHIGFDARTNSIWVQESPARTQAIKQLIAALDVPVRQVMIKARIVNVSEAHEEEFGVRFGLTASKSVTGTLSEDASAQHFNVDMPAVTLFNQPASIGIAVAEIGSDSLLDLELSAMERDSVLEIIASPRLIASDEKAALIESGSEIPYQEQTAGGGASATFKKAVMSLQVTPKITQQHNILLTLEIKQDKIGMSTEQGNAIDTQHIQTQVLVKNGETIVVGGIEETVQRTIIEKVPFLGDIPWIGVLFTHKAVSLDKKELLVFITPSILEVV